ncbi:bacteriophage tail fiber protein [Yersinia frederiksenii]|nr:bacteriophage tail fiber protein [Yersinia frederiksenii]
MQKIGNIPNTRADNNGEFTDGNVAGGVPPTILPAEWFNTIQRELISVLSAAGITPDSNKFDQVSKAVSKLITDGGFLKTVNNLSEIKTAGAPAIAATLSNIGALSTTGTAAAATKLATARKISGVDFDGTKDITLPFINTTDANIQLAGNLTAQGHITSQGSLISKTNIGADGRCDIVGDLRGGRILSKGDLIAGEGRAEGHATLAVDGNVHGTVWGGALSSYIANNINVYGVVALGRGAQVAMPSSLYNMMSPAGTFLTGVTVNGNGQTTTVYYRGLFMQRSTGGWVQMGGDIG